MFDVFISYSTGDASDAEWLETELKAANVNVWFDRARIAAGDSPAEKVFTGMSRSCIIVFLLTPRVAVSKWVREEASAARTRRINQGDVTLIPLLFETCDVPEVLRDIRQIDFRHDRARAMRELLDRVSQTLGTTSGTTQVSPEVAEFLRALGRQDELSDPTSRLATIDRLFVPPAELPTIRRILDERHCVFVVGDPHTGKTYTCLYLLLQLFVAGYEPVWVNYDALAYRLRHGADVDQLARTWLRQKSACYFEDPFGSVTHHELAQFEHGLGRLVEEARAKDARLLITSRDYIFDEAIGEELREHVVRLRCQLKVGDSYSEADLQEVARRYIDLYRLSLDPDVTADPALPGKLSRLAAPHNVEVAVRGLRNAHSSEEAAQIIETTRDLVSHVAAQMGRLPLEDQVFLVVVGVFSEDGIPENEKRQLLDRVLVQLDLLRFERGLGVDCFALLAQRNRAYVGPAVGEVQHVSRHNPPITGSPPIMEIESHQLRHPSYLEALRARLVEPLVRRVLESLIVAALEIANPAETTELVFLRLHQLSPLALRGTLEGGSYRIDRNCLLESAIRVAVDHQCLTPSVESGFMALLTVASPPEHVCYALARFLRPVFRELSPTLLRQLMTTVTEGSRPSSHAQMYLTISILESFEGLPAESQPDAKAAFERLLSAGLDGAAWVVADAVCDGNVERPFNLPAANIPPAARSCSLLHDREWLLTVMASGTINVRMMAAACLAQGRNRNLPGASRLASQLRADPDDVIREILEKGLHNFWAENL